MSGREWKPGDVAMVDGYVSVRANSDAWYRSAPKDVLLVDSDSPNARPLVVLDPEDREQVERLRNETLRMLRDHIGNRAVDESAFTECDLANAMQAALREFANPTPPKPAEPTGLGAVVEDADGERWVRGADVELGGGVWLRELFIGGGSPLSKQYAAVNAVRVLSEGVTL